MVNTKAQDHWQITCHSSEILPPDQRLCPWKQIHNKALTHLTQYPPIQCLHVLNLLQMYSAEKRSWEILYVQVRPPTIWYSTLNKYVTVHNSLWQNNKLMRSFCFAVSPKFMQAHTQTVESGCSGAAVPGSLKGVWTRGCVTGVPGGLNPGHLLKWLLIPLMQTTCPTCCALFKTRPWTL